MKILIAHNKYRQRGGEDAVAQSEFNLLKDYGHDVRFYERSNSETENLPLLDKVRFLLSVGWSRRSYNEMRKILQEFRPDVVHFHNIFFVLTPSACSACRDEGIPVVQSLHNFRFICPNGLFLRGKNICEECAQRKSFWKGVFCGCYKKSRWITLMLAGVLSYHWRRKTWVNMVDYYIMSTEFGRKKYVDFGIPASKIVVKSNVIYPNHFKNKKDGRYGLYIGRLSQEKGVDVLLEAWKHIDEFPLKIMGDGPLFNDLNKYVADENIKNVEFLGFVSSQDYLNHIQSASFLVIPSVCYENFPCVVSEALACGIPIIASELGGMPEIIKNKEMGFLFKAGDAGDLVKKIKSAIDLKDGLDKMRVNVLKEYEEKYSPERNHDALMEIYNKAMN